MQVLVTVAFHCNHYTVVHCSELGREAREAAEAEARVAREGVEKRKAMITEAAVLLQEKRNAVQEKEARKAELEATKAEKQRIKEEAEAPEKGAF